MKVSMKYWKIGAYFGSIALAVGIGVFATTAREVGVGSDSCNSGSPATGNCKNLVGINICDITYYRKEAGSGHLIGGGDEICYAISAGDPADAPSRCGTILSSENGNSLGNSDTTDCE
jgi:hypothetical protein